MNNFIEIIMRMIARIACAAASISTCLHAQPWQQIHPAFPVNEITGIIHWRGDTIFASGTNWSLIRSIDRGITWTPMLGRNSLFLDINSLETNGNMLFLWIEPQNVYPNYTVTFNSHETKHLYSYNPYRNDTTRISVTAPDTTWKHWHIGAMSAKNGCLAILINNELINSSTYASYICFSSDDGKTFSAQPIPDSLSALFGSIEFFDRNHGILTARPRTNGARRKAYVTHDGGVTWLPTPFIEVDSYNSKNYMLPYPIHWINDSTIAIAYSGEVYVSRDSGSTWRQTSTIRWHGSGGKKIASVQFFDNGVGFVTTESRHICRTIDWGETWIQIKSEDDRGIGIGCDVVLDEHTFLAGSNRGVIHRTDDDGLTWDDIHYSTIGDIQSIHFFSATEGFVLAGYTLYYTSDNCRSFQKRYSFSNNITLHPLTRSELILIQNRDSIDALIYRSTDGGFHWTTLYVYPGVDTTVIVLTKASIRDLDTIIVASANGKLLRTYDGGKTWQVSNDGVSKGIAPFHRLSMKYSDRGWMSSRDGLFTTTDEGEHWNSVFLSNKVSMIHNIFELDRGELFVLSEENFPVQNCLFRTTNGGKTWTRNETQEDVSSPSYFFENGICFSSGAIIKRSTNYWLTADVQYTFFSRHPSGNLSSSFLDEKRGWIGGPNGLILHSRSGGIDDVRTTSNEVGTIHLSQNYPNPTSSLTMIPFEISSDVTSHNLAQGIKLVVYDLLGREVATIAREELDVGKNQISFDASRLQAGVYCYRLIVGEQAVTRKMVVVR